MDARGARRWAGPASLLILAAFLTACGGSGGGAATGEAGPPATAEPTDGGAAPGEPIGGATSIELRDGNTVEPAALTIRLGDTVTWTNASASVHTATADPDNPLGIEHALPDGADPFNSGNLGPDETFQHTFEVAGEYRWSCMLHRSMTGTIVVE